MATLVFDIETAARPWDQFDDFTKTKIGQYDEESKEYRPSDSLSLSPLTGEVIAIGLYDIERRQQVVYYQDEVESVSWEVDGCTYKPSTEAAMLEDFWEGAKSYDVFVTFAGRAFDVPFLNIRSAAHGIAPSKDLMQHRFLSRQVAPYHVDLQDQFSYYGSVGRKPSLHLCCETFGIESSKVAGVSGADVAEFFREKKFRDIARYNARDVTATAELYKKWFAYLAPASFKALGL